jgi:hypothetical protein
MRINTFLFFLMMQGGVFAQTNKILNGDQIYVRGFRVQPDNFLYYNASEKNMTIFTIKKFPNYQSINNSILTGQTVLLTTLDGKQCCVDNKTKNVKCECSPDTPPSLRILDKHGQDKAILRNAHYVKFRELKSNIDCSIENQSPLICNAKSTKTQEYGFVIFKVL